VLVATSPEEMQLELVTRVEQAGTDFNMHMNAIKATVMTNADCKVTVTVNGSVYIGTSEAVLIPWHSSARRCDV